MEKFPFEYLELQLGIGQLTHSEWQPIVDDVLKIVRGWQRELVTRLGHIIFVNQVVRVCLTCHLIVEGLPKWALERVDKGCQAFLGWI